MRGLLERWAKVEPERCRPPEGLAPFPAVLYAGEFWPVGNDAAPFTGTVQAAVQEAIEARGLPWQLNHGFTDDYEATIWTDAAVGVEGHGYTEASAAAALLGAYLDALEARETTSST